MTVPRVSVFLLCVAVACTTCGAAQLVIDGSLPGGGACALMGTWIDESNTCRIDDHLIVDGDTVRIVSATLEVVGTLTNEGVLDNRGLIVVEGFLNSTNDLVNFWDGELINRGEFFSHFMYNFGPLLNEPTGSIEFEWHLENNAPMVNLGSITIGGTYINIQERTLHNRGTLDVEPTGRLTNGGLLVNEGSIDNLGTLINDDVFVAHCLGIVTGNPVEGNPTTYAQALFVGAGLLEWCAISGASSYDVVRGDLDVLRLTGGDFASATALCVGDDLPGFSIAEGSEPPVGGGFWFVVRPNDVATPTYDSRFDSQVGPRDPGIDSSAAACP
jgi:hypothetical protein